MAAPHDRPVLLCYDGSDHAQEAIRRAGALMGAEQRAERPSYAMRPDRMADTITQDA